MSSLHPTKPQGPTKPRLLLVEDDRVTYTALRVLLGTTWDVTIATTLADALRLLDSVPDVVVLDLMLPDGDGAELLKRVRSLRLNSRVVVTTGSHDPARLNALNRLRPHAVMQKPIDLAELQSNLSNP